MEQDTIESRLAKAKNELESIKYKQTYNFSSIVTRQINNSTAIWRANGYIHDPFDFRLNLAPTDITGTLLVKFTPVNGKLLPLKIDVRFRATNNVDELDVLAAPNYNTSAQYITTYIPPPNPITGVYIVELYYLTGTTGLGAYIKFIGQGFDDYTLGFA